MIVESKDYAQVVFEDVKECYLENQPLECLFNLNGLLKASDTDWIGIYRVGFNTYKDFVCTQQVNLSLINENKGKIVFDDKQVPKDDGDFYQFVYVSHSKQIRGASIPFQFKRLHLSDYVEFEEQEAVCYKSKESAINDTITEIKARCNHLTIANETYEKLIKENEEIISTLKDEIASVKLRCMRLTMDNEKLNYTLRTKADTLKNLTETLNTLTNENTRLQSKFDGITAENKSLHESLQQRVLQVEQLKSDLETVKINKEELENVVSSKEGELLELRKDKRELTRIADDLKHINISSLEKQVNERVDELNTIKSDLKRNEVLVGEQADTIQNILNERDALNNLIQKLTKEKNDLESSQENLSQELNMSRDKLLAAEQCKEMLRAQVVVLTNELNASNSKIETYLGKISESASREKQHEMEREEWSEQMRKQKLEYEMKLDEASGSYYALRLAHSHLENKLKTNEQTMKAKYEKDVEYFKENMEKYKQENEELKDRIKAGAKEYSKLMEKYHLVKNQQFTNDINNMYQDLSNEATNNRRDVFQNAYNNKQNTNNNNTNNMILRQRIPTNNTALSNNNNNNNNSESDSAISDKTMSQSVRVSSSAEIENTLLDALLSTSLYGWQGNNNNNKNNNNKIEPTNTNNTNQITTSQPRMASLTRSTHESLSNLNPNYQQTSDLSDDGLIHPNNNNNTEKQCDLRFRLNSTNKNILDNDDNVFETNVKPQVATNNNIIYPNLPTSDLTSKQQSTIATQAPRNNFQFDGNNARICDICHYIFPSESSINEIEKHYALHYGPSCPICFLTFRKGFPQTEFENHVNGHFNS